MTEMENIDEMQQTQTETSEGETRQRLGPNVCEYCETDFLEIEFEMKEDGNGGVSIVCDIEDCGQLFPNFNEYKIHHRKTCPQSPTEIKKTSNNRAQSLKSKTRKKSEGCIIGARKSLRNRKHSARSPNTDSNQEIIRNIDKSLKRKLIWDDNKSVRLDIGLTHTCETCAATFTSFRSLKRHIRTIHELAFKEICDICGKGCLDKSSLTSHLLTHTTERKYQCEECGWQCKREFQLVYHRRKHTNEKPHQCHVCGKGFRVNNWLQKHMVTHAKEVKEFPCDICGKLFASKGYVTSHIWAQHKEKGTKELETLASQ